MVKDVRAGYEDRFVFGLIEKELLIVQGLGFSELLILVDGASPA